MKTSFLCSNTYSDPAAHEQFYPAPRNRFDATLGGQELDRWLEFARTADALGFDYVSVSEHHYAPLMVSPNAAVLAGALSQTLQHAGIAWLGPIVSIANPVRVAEEIAMLDQLTGGRLLVFLLRGTPNEFVTYNVDPSKTRAITEEASLLIRRALTEPEPFAWKGDQFDFPVVSVWPGATQHPHPPLLTSGMSVDSVRFSARNRFGIAISFYPPDIVAQLTDLYRTECDSVGFTPTSDQLLYRAFIAVGETDAHAEELRERFVPRELPKVPPPAGIGTDADGRRHEGADQGGAGFAFGALQFCGSAESVVAQIREFHAQTGIGHLDLAFTLGGITYAEAHDSLRRFGEQVLPQIRDLSDDRHAVGAGGVAG